MSRLKSEQLTRGSRSLTDLGRRGSDLAEEAASRIGIQRPGLAIAGLVAVGFGAYIFYKFGPDLRRYLKMVSM